VSRFLEAASHALVAATAPNIGGAIVGPSAMRPVGGPAATGYVSGAGIRDRFHVGQADRGDRGHADRVDPAGTAPQAATAASTSILVNGLVFPPSPPLPPQIPALGTPLLVPSTTLVPLKDRARDPAVALDMVAEAAARLVAAANMITDSRKRFSANMDATSPFVGAINMRATTHMATSAAHRIPTDSNDAADNTVAAAATVAPAAKMVAPVTHAGAAVNAVPPAGTTTAPVKTVEIAAHAVGTRSTPPPASTVSRAIETISPIGTGAAARKCPAASTVAALTSTGVTPSTIATPASTSTPVTAVARYSTGAAVCKKVAPDTPTGEETHTVAACSVGAAACGGAAGRTCAIARTGAPACTVAAASKTVSPVGSGAAADTGASACTVAAASKTVPPIGSGAASHTGAAANTVTTPETVYTAEETVAATSTAGALKTPASVASTCASTRRNANADAGFVVYSGAAGNSMDIDAPSTDKVHFVDSEARSPRSGVTSTRDLWRTGTPSLRFGGRSASEKRTAGRNADANALHQLCVCACCFTHFCSLC